MRKGKLHFLTAVILIFLFGCEYKYLRPNQLAAVDCGLSSLNITLKTKTDATACNLTDGMIQVTSSGGFTPYAFNINGGPFQSSSWFSNLAPGIYTVQVKDSVQCVRSVVVNVSASGSTLDATFVVNEDNECFTDNGSFDVTATGGTGPYTYQLGNGEFTSKHAYDNLASGFYSLTVKDANGCPKAISIVVPRGTTGVSYLNDIKPIVTTKCAISGCHNGDNGAVRNWTVFETFQKNAANVKLRTGNKSMPLVGSLTDEQIQLIACWVDDGAKNN